MVEKIDNPERFVKKVTLKDRILKFLRKNIYYIPFLLFFGALGGVLWVYREDLKEKFSLEVAYDKTIEIDDYVMKGKDNLEIVKDKISAKKKSADQGRYEKFVSGKDVVAVNFGEVVWSDEKKPITPEADTTLAEIKVDTAVQQPEAAVPSVPTKTVIKYVKVPEPVAATDTAQVRDTVDSVSTTPVLFASIALSNNRKEYVSAFVYGDQEITDNSLVRFRLAEDLYLEGSMVVPAGTVFRGKAAMNQNVITVSVDRIDRHDVSALIYDRDYSLGIILNSTPGDEMNETLNRSLYRSGERSLTDIPFDVAQDVTRNIIRNRRRKDRVVKLSDGDPVYIALNQ